MTDAELASKIEYRAALLKLQEAAAKAVLVALPGMRKKARTDQEARKAVRLVEAALRKKNRAGNPGHSAA